MLQNENPDLAVAAGNRSADTLDEEALGFPDRCRRWNRSPSRIVFGQLHVAICEFLQTNFDLAPPYHRDTLLQSENEHLVFGVIGDLLR